MLEGLKKQYFSFCFTSVIVSQLILPTSANAQKVSSDGTLPTGVTSTDNLNFVIDSLNNSNRINNNLFHSFKEFSIPTGGSAVFNNPADVVNIINRVTGGNISNIDGLIKANGNANVFLINPSGIVFGQNAALDIGGSFIGSTASSIEFANGWKFSADDIYSPPLLTINMPLGLQMGQNPGEIQVNGYGHDLVTEDPVFTPYFSLGFAPGLKVKPGYTLALLGSDINLNGGNLTAASGRIELGSLGNNSKVELNSIKEGFTFKYNDISNYKDIQLNQNSLLNVSGEGAGSIQVRGKNINVNDGSVIWGQNSFLSFQPGGDIDINASEVLSLNGMNADETLRSSIVSETLGFGRSGNINISAKGLSLQNGVTLGSKTFTPAPSGNLSVNTTDFIQLDGISPITGAFNIMGTATATTGKAGDVSVTTRNLSLGKGSYLAAVTFGDGSGGNVLINSEKTELIAGLNQFSSISTDGYGSGNSGNLTLNTRSLRVENGANISTASLRNGSAGNLIINAKDFVEVTGIMPGTDFSSYISSEIGAANSIARQFVPGSDKATGNAGNVTINTPSLKISRKGRVSVANFGIGTAGTLKIDAGSVELNQGIIEATTISGEGGNIVFNLQEKLLIRNNSTISAEAGSTGNGGNITINSPVIVGVENSDIIANAFQGNGGNIDINTQGIFGLQFREKLTEESDITASSEFGVDGVVKINNLNVNPTSGAIELPKDVIDSNQQIASGCIANSGNSFEITGKGGFPANPNNIQSQIVWNDLRKIKIDNNRSARIYKKPTKPKRIVEATGMVVDAEGNIEFVAQSNGENLEDWQGNVNCAGS